MNGTLSRNEVTLFDEQTKITGIITTAILLSVHEKKVLPFIFYLILGPLNVFNNKWSQIFRKIVSMKENFTVTFPLAFPQNSPLRRMKNV